MTVVQTRQVTHIMMGIEFDRLRAVDPVRLKKTVLAQQAGQRFAHGDMPPGQRSELERLARLFVRDLSDQVRAALAFEVRLCSDLPGDIAEAIARDVEDVAAPFLAATPALSDAQMAALLPSLSEASRVVVARRADLGCQAQAMLVKVGGERSVTYMVRNPCTHLQEHECRSVVTRFAGHPALMTALAARAELPLAIIAELIDKVSDEARRSLLVRHKQAASLAGRMTGAAQLSVLAAQVQRASRGQLTALAVDLNQRGRLDHSLILALAARGGWPFAESALAILAGMTVQELQACLARENREVRALLRRLGATPEECVRYDGYIAARARRG